MSLIPMIIENFEGGNPKLNLHLISVVKKMIESHELSLEELGQMGVIDKVSSVMRVIQEQDWCVEKMLDILFELLTITTETLRNKRNEQAVVKITEPLCENFTSCTKILGFINEPVRFKQGVADKSANCLLLLLQLYAHKISTNPSQDVVNSLFAILAFEKSNLRTRALRVIRSIGNSGFKGSLSSEVLNRLRGLNDKEVQDVLAEFFR
jgi:hypothetical protein